MAVLPGAVSTCGVVAVDLEGIRMTNKPDDVELTIDDLNDLERRTLESEHGRHVSHDYLLKLVALARRGLLASPSRVPIEDVTNLVREAKAKAAYIGHAACIDPDGKEGSWGDAQSAAEAAIDVLVLRLTASPKPPGEESGFGASSRPALETIARLSTAIKRPVTVEGEPEHEGIVDADGNLFSHDTATAEIYTMSCLYSGSLGAI